uniref:Uncharacterized protein n=1 Tax=Daphnia magna TaxID=35525 RepID=A0A0N8E674_9CRUS
MGLQLLLQLLKCLGLWFKCPRSPVLFLSQPNTQIKIRALRVPESVCFCPLFSLMIQSSKHSSLFPLRPRIFPR